jgi:hypothetical protein
MSKLQLNEHRRITFTFPLVLDAALVFDREHNGWLWRASGHVMKLAPSADGSISIEALRSGATAPESSDRPAAWVAAALLHYCFKRRVPIPRLGVKRIELMTDSIDLVIAMSMQVLPIELQAPAPAEAPATTG